MQRCPDGPEEAQDWDNDDEEDIQPVEMLIPILPRDWQLTDMRRLAHHFGMPVPRKWLVSMEWLRSGFFSVHSEEIQYHYNQSFVQI